METLETIADLRAALAPHRLAGAAVGVVPTMGYLHDGHVSLIERAVAECDVVVTTLFVNPLQFAAGEDLSAYPRDPDGDAAKASAAGAAILFAPPVGEMYPRPGLTTVSVRGLSSIHEGAARPTHFDGVTTVVAKLFNLLAGPSRAYFGEKDFQQLAVVRRMVADLDFPVDVVGCPTVREADGLAMSSRNAYLTAPERAAAPVLHRALQAGAATIAAGESDAARVRAAMRQVVEAEPLADLDYLDVIDPDTLEPVEAATAAHRLIGAARFGRARLIDNIPAG